MTKEEKELLLKDLSARLPYHVRCKIWLKDGTTEEGPLDLEHNYADVLLHAFYYNDIKDIKPYLRPMSSMTEEERKEYKSFIIHREHVNAQGQEWDIDCFSFGSVPRLIDWLNAHHFDYRGLIKKGLTLEAPKDMYNTNEVDKED